jgi:hypothetical protein
MESAIKDGSFINFYMMSKMDSILTLEHMIQYTHQTL